MTEATNPIPTDAANQDLAKRLDAILHYYPEFTGIHPVSWTQPPLNVDDMFHLTESIRNDGLAVEIFKTPDGLLLDGRHRLLACFDAMVEIRVRVYRSDPACHVQCMNQIRRHLTPEQAYESECALQAYELDNPWTPPTQF